VSAKDGTVKNVRPVRERECKGKGAQKYRQLLDGKEEPAEKDHGKTEKVGERLSLEDLAHGHGDEKAQKCGSNRYQENSRKESRPKDRGEVC